MRRLPEKAWENLFWQLLSMQIHILTGERQAQLKEKQKISTWSTFKNSYLKIIIIINLEIDTKWALMCQGPLKAKKKKGWYLHLVNDCLFLKISGT